MAAKKVLEAAERVVGEPVRDAVPIVGRPTKAWIFGAIGFVVGRVIAKALDVPDPWDYAVAGGVGGIAMTAGMTFRFLVRTEQNLLLTSSKRWIGRPKEVISTVPAASITIENSIINRKITVGADTFVLARRSEARVHAMLADLIKPVPPGHHQYIPD